MSRVMFRNFTVTRRPRPTRSFLVLQTPIVLQLLTQQPTDQTRLRRPSTRAPLYKKRHASPLTLTQRDSWWLARLQKQYASLSSVPCCGRKEQKRFLCNRGVCGTRTTLRASSRVFMGSTSSHELTPKSPALLCCYDAVEVGGEYGVPSTGSLWSLRWKGCVSRAHARYRGVCVAPSVGVCGIDSKPESRSKMKQESQWNGNAAGTQRRRGGKRTAWLSPCRRLQLLRYQRREGKISPLLP